MKIAVCLLVVVLVVSIEAFPNNLRTKRGFRNGAADRFSHGFGKRNGLEDNMDLTEESKRGFRKGAADRFSHGFGKRFDMDDIKDMNTEQPEMTVEEVAELLMSSPKLSYSFVKKYLDRNGDGMVSRDELMANDVRV